MKSFLRNFLITGVPFGVWMGVYFAITESSAERGLLMGLLAGAFFGLAMAIVFQVQQNRASLSPPVLIDEVLIRESPANHTVGRSGCAGRLYLTDKRIFFEALPVNKPALQNSIPIHEVVELKRKKIFGIFPVRLEVILKNGKPESFTTDDVNGWIDEISAVRQCYLDTPRPDDARLFA